MLFAAHRALYRVQTQMNGQSHHNKIVDQSAGIRFGFTEFYKDFIYPFMAEIIFYVIDIPYYRDSFDRVSCQICVKQGNACNKKS